MNRANLVTLPESQWKAAIDSMARAGIRLLRTNIAPPLDAVPSLVRHANDQGLDVVLTIPTWLPQMYPDGTRPRPGNKHYWDAWPISRIDPGKFRAFWTAHRLAMRAAGARVYAYQLGNEINGPGFNGDYPVDEAARVLALNACDLASACPDIHRGFAVHVQLLKFIRESSLLDGALLIAASMGFTTPEWAARTRGYFSDVGDAIAYIDKLGAREHADAYAVHIYPNYWAKTPQDEERNVRRSLAAIADACNAAGHARRPCWMTEWGIWSATESCDIDPKRDFLLMAGARALQDLIRAKRLDVALHYDWDGDKTLSVYRCGRVVTGTIDDIIGGPNRR